MPKSQLEFTHTHARAQQNPIVCVNKQRMKGKTARGRAHIKSCCFINELGNRLGILRMSVCECVHVCGSLAMQPHSFRNQGGCLDSIGTCTHTHAHPYTRKVSNKFTLIHSLFSLGKSQQFA